MLLYNVTVKIDGDIEAEWLHWMKSHHIPDVMNTGQFSSARISKLQDQPIDDDPTYVVQYECESQEKLNRYLTGFANELREDFNRRYKDKFVLFRTVMEVVG
jgi:hypothetical protein